MALDNRQQRTGNRVVLASTKRPLVGGCDVAAVVTVDADSDIASTKSPLVGGCDVVGGVCHGREGSFYEEPPRRGLRHAQHRRLQRRQQASTKSPLVGGCDSEMLSGRFSEVRLLRRAPSSGAATSSRLRPSATSVLLRRAPSSGAATRSSPGCGGGRACFYEEPPRRGLRQVRDQQQRQRQLASTKSPLVGGCDELSMSLLVTPEKRFYEEPPRRGLRPADWD